MIFMSVTTFSGSESRSKVQSLNIPECFFFFFDIREVFFEILKCFSSIKTKYRTIL